MQHKDIVEIIVSHAKSILPKLDSQEIRAEDSLADLGANSIDRSEIVMLTMDSLSLDIPLVLVARANNISELAEIFHEKLH